MLIFINIIFSNRLSCSVDWHLLNTSAAVLKTLYRGAIDYKVVFRDIISLVVLYLIK